MPPSVRQTALIGRVDELHRLAELLDGEGRLLTLVGVGGVGKTRLASAAATGWAGERRSFVALGLHRARTLRDVLDVGAQVLGVPLPDTQDDHVALGWFGERLSALGEAIVVLDNLEQIVDLMLRALPVWLRAAPRARFLCTSRRPLRLPDEVAYPVEPLTTGADGDAVRLLLACARAGGLEADARDLDDVCAIAARLDGIPLALELAAARLPLVGWSGLLRRLEARRDVLSRPAETEHDHHASLRATLEWSWDDLDPRDRHALAALSVFAADFDAEAAEAVVGAGALDALSILHERSLLTKTDLRPEPRFRLLQPVRDFAADKLATLDDPKAPVRRHRAHYVALAVETAVAFERAHARLALQTFERERAELWLVVDGTDPGDAASIAEALRLLVAAEPLSATRGGSGPHVAAVERTLAMPRAADVDPVLRVRARITALRLRRLDLRAVSSPDDAAAVVDLAREAGGTYVAEARAVHGAILCAAGRFEEGLRGLREAAQAEQATPRVRSFASTIASSWSRVCGLVEPATAFGREAVQIARDAGLEQMLGMALVELGAAEAERGELTFARRDLEEALALQRELGDERMTVMTSLNLARIVYLTGDAGAAARSLGECARTARRIGASRLELFAVGYRGLVLVELRELPEAIALLEAARRGALESRAFRFASLFGAFLAVAHAASGDLSTAQALLDEALAHAPKGDAALAGVLEVSSANVMCFRGRTGPDAEAHRLRAAAVLSACTPPGSDGAAALRILRAFHPDAVPVVRAPESTSTETLWVETSGLARTPNGTLDVRTRPAVRRLFLALVEARLRTPTRFVPLEELIKATWPDEKIRASAAKNRLHVTMNRLRGLGLRDLVEAQATGYRLATTVDVRIVDALPTG